MEKNSFHPYFLLGFTKEKTPACLQVNDINIDSFILASFCLCLIDSVSSKIPEKNQIEFKSEALRLLSFMIENHKENDLLNFT